MTDKEDTEYMESLPEKGEVFDAEIDRISNSGNGIVEVGDKHINLGPISKEYVGDEIKAKMKGGNSAHIIDCPKLTGAGRTVQIMCSFLGNKGFGITENEDKVIVEGNVQPNDIVKVERTGVNEDGIMITEVVNQETEHNEKSDDKGVYDDSQIDDEKNTKHASNSTGIPSTNRTNQTYYDRDPKVRENVLSRAEDECEGCGQKAPFLDKTGRPYLQAHHIDELSDGGEDTVQNVIALCPNCHYRVHHGKEGDKYNEKLREILREKYDE